VELGASCSTLAAPIVDAPPAELSVLGCSASALYLDAGDTVVAVLTQRAVQLPCSVILPTASLAGLEPDASVRLGSAELRWRRGRVDVRVRLVRRWTPPRVGAVDPRQERIDELAAAVDVPAIQVGSLLGRGPGLTPSGDDVLAGYLLACRAFGVPAEILSAAILRDAATRTTALSRSLLRLAADGWCIRQAAALIASLARCDPDPAALRALLAVGSSSGAALAAGIAAAAAKLRLGATA
jgi:hypothetical protein